MKLVTIDIGNKYIRPNVMDSHKAAAERWGMEYVVIDRPIGPKDDNAHLRTQMLIHHMVDGPFFYVDGDAAIASHAVNPSTYLDQGNDFAAVPMFFLNSELMPPISKIMAYQRTATLMANSGNYEGFAPHTYFNAGMFMSSGSRNVARAFAEGFAIEAHSFRGKVGSQDGINVGLWINGVEFVRMEHFWNDTTWVCDGGKTRVNANSFVWHLAGSVDGINKSHALDNINWRDPNAMTGKDWTQMARGE